VHFYLLTPNNIGVRVEDKTNNIGSGVRVIVNVIVEVSL
jgi:hypothetical protein